MSEDIGILQGWFRNKLTSDDYDLAGQGREMTFVDADLCHCRDCGFLLTFNHAFIETIHVGNRRQARLDICLSAVDKKP